LLANHFWGTIYDRVTPAVIQVIHQKRMTIEADNSRGERVDKIQSLTQQIHRLSHSADSWNGAIIVMMIVAALAATGLVITQYIAVRKAQRLSALQGQLDVAKDVQLRINLHTKDEEIASAKKDAGEAYQKAEGFRLAIAQANQRAAEATQSAEEERLARVRIEEKLAGWKLDAAAQARIIGKLNKYKKTPFDLGTDPGELPFMETMDGLLGSAGWVRQLPKPDNPLFNILLDNKARINYVSGIYVELAPSSVPNFGPAAEELVKSLRAEGIPAQGQIAIKEKDPSCIHLVIGKK
jgi:hypothetical protein